VGGGSTNPNRNQKFFESAKNNGKMDQLVSAESLPALRSDWIVKIQKYYIISKLEYELAICNSESVNTTEIVLRGPRALYSAFQFRIVLETS
jgi:septum formation topological specificity factor MinE